MLSRVIRKGYKEGNRTDMRHFQFLLFLVCHLAGLASRRNSAAASVHATLRRQGGGTGGTCSCHRFVRFPAGCSERRGSTCLTGGSCLLMFESFHIKNYFDWFLESARTTCHSALLITSFFPLPASQNSKAIQPSLAMPTHTSAPAPLPCTIPAL